MPTTFTSLILFALLAMPGIAYVTRRHRDMPHQVRSIFRETVTVAVAGIVLNLVVLVPLLTAAAIWPPAVIDVSALIDNSRSYLAEHWVRVGLWAFLALAVATGLAFLAAKKVTTVHPSDSSSWHVLFNEWRRGYDIHVGCELTDGSWIGGEVANYNPTTVENGDRDLILEQPVMYRPQGHDEAIPYGTEGSVCVSAGHIRLMFVNYLTKEVNSSLGAGAEVEAASGQEEKA